MLLRQDLGILGGQADTHGPPLPSPFPLRQTPEWLKVLALFQTDHTGRHEARRPALARPILLTAPKRSTYSCTGTFQLDVAEMTLVLGRFPRFTHGTAKAYRGYRQMAVIDSL